MDRAFQRNILPIWHSRGLSLLVVAAIVADFIVSIAIEANYV
ncbi:hypothetical protein ACULTK_002821 [Yersinia enterocolitica]|uniref:Uncharacterized protein n=3 Tax=Yersinia enterocolitica TaxID=630 RepID=A0A0H3NL70_YERE1|nr:hypothetical protein [Yersinia enterocolitica]CBX70653.1 unknown protein [Yersinia enterocolitica W22703]CBY25860.1 hypothetical protein Y11_23211 [Yersinia enterocolitica subsp. palearctica Y11]CCO70230.1 FIG01220037: hypothetical protein [Yersinia enterocolitica IP 10393]UXD26481.1 hypothetical protein FORC065_3736 [Yersinia enterocolitica]UXD27922.1 hypothetical protein FORC066_0706 [Yersinia enterocolitica]